MNAKVLIILCFALSFCVEVYGEGGQELKREQFPFMAFLYYPDETIVDESGARFLRGAVLIRPDWLISSAISFNETKGFPQKTLLARVGADSIDPNFTLNEDEDEQEREIIQIVRPYNHSTTKWWHSDISLLKTLLPFNMTPVVSFTSLNNKMETAEKTCIILVYAKTEGNLTEDRNLMQLTVELLLPSVASCGHRFLEKKMLCALDSEENQNSVYDPNFCQGNSGGPLICNGKVVGLQTYIDDDCKQPHLYQLLSAWENFITCGTELKNREEQCSKICDVSYKDPPEMDSNDTTMIVLRTASINEAIVTDTTFDTTAVDSDNHPVIHTETTQDSTTVEITTNRPITTRQTTLDEPAKHATSIIENITEPKSPNEKDINARKTMGHDDLDIRMRKPQVESQREVVRDGSNTGQNILDLYLLIFGYILLGCLV